MTRLRRILDLPLLSKELKELAARRRTYLVRFVYALLLFAGACLVLYGNIGGGRTGGLGQGRHMFAELVLFQFAGIVLFLPAMASGVLTSEKERDALGLLLLTALSPWQILLQKWLSRLVPMISFLLLSFPLLAVAYSYGGVSEEHLFWGILLLILTCLQVGAIAVMCSAYFRTTAESFVMTYILIATIATVTTSFSGLHGFELVQRGLYSDVSSLAIMILISIVVALLFGRMFLVSRAFIPPRNALLQLFRALDEFFNSANSLTGGIVLVKDRDVFPRHKPVAWRETRKKSLGTFRYLFRVLAVLEVPILFNSQMIRIKMHSRTGSMTDLLYVLWCISAGMVAVHAAGLISSERSRQTLDVLLTTPLSAREIISQKFSGVRRLIAVLFVPLLSIFLFETWWYADMRIHYLVYSTALVAIHLPMIAWLSMWIGLKLRSHLRAFITTLLILTAWITIPTLIGPPFPGAGTSRITPTGPFADPLIRSPLDSALVILSPVDIVVSLEHWSLRTEEVSDLPWFFPQRDLPYLIHIAFYGLLLLFFRALCFRNADKQLGRVGEATSPLLREEPIVPEMQEALA